MRILQSRIFKKTVKRLHANQKSDLDETVRKIVERPECGAEKKGDLAGVRVLKFQMAGSLTLLAYEWDEMAETVTLLALGGHENFYRDLKR